MKKVQIDSFRVIGIKTRTSNHGNALQDIGGLWNRFLGDSLMNEIPNKLDHNIYAVYTEYDGTYEDPYSVILGCAVEEHSKVPTGMVDVKIPTSDYEQFVAKGDLEKGVVYETWRKIWETDLPRAYEADYEVYGARTADRANAEVDIFIGIK